MKILTIKNYFFALFFFVFFLVNNSSFAQNVTVIQDEKFELLLKEKRKVNSSITINNRYKIQIFIGNNENSKNALIEFKKEFKSYDATIIFNTPNYKVLVGNYKTRIEAERNLNVLKKRYANAFILKPNK